MCIRDRYAPPLAKALEALGYATVQPVLRSSYAQFGFGSLDNDVEDLEELLGCEAFGGVEEVFMVGHSTGSQICAHYARHGKAEKKLSVCLQGGVSDRETDSEQEVVGAVGKGRRRARARTPAGPEAVSCYIDGSHDRETSRRGRARPDARPTSRHRLHRRQQMDVSPRGRCSRERRRSYPALGRRRFSFHAHCDGR